MPVAQKEAGRTKGKLFVAQAKLSREIETFQSVIETFLYEMANLRQNLNRFFRIMEELDATKELWEYITGVNSSAIKYQIHFLGPFTALLQSIRQYLDVRFAYATPKEQRLFSEIYREIEFYQNLIDKYAKKIDLFTETLSEIVLVGEEETFQPKEKIMANIQNALKLDAVGGFADNAEQEVARHLSGMRYMTDRIRPFLER